MIRRIDFILVGPVRWDRWISSTMLVRLYDAFLGFLRGLGEEKDERLNDCIGCVKRTVTSARLCRLYALCTWFMVYMAYGWKADREYEKLARCGPRAAYFWPTDSLQVRDVRYISYANRESNCVWKRCRRLVYEFMIINHLSEWSEKSILECYPRKRPGMPRSTPASPPSLNMLHSNIRI